MVESLNGKWDLLLFRYRALPLHGRGKLSVTAQVCRCVTSRVKGYIVIITYFLFGYDFIQETVAMILDTDHIYLNFFVFWDVDEWVDCYFNYIYVGNPGFISRNSVFKHAIPFLCNIVRTEVIWFYLCFSLWWIYIYSSLNKQLHCFSADLCSMLSNCFHAFQKPYIQGAF